MPRCVTAPARPVCNHGMVKRLLLAIIVLVTALAPAAGAVARSAATPTLRLASVTPVTVRGTGFKRLEAIKVTAVGEDRSWTRRVRASTTGVFLASFPTIEDRCTVISLRAAGAYGSRAVRKLAQPGCVEQIP